MTREEESFVNSLRGKIFKIIPIHEDGNDTLDKYIESLLVEMRGGAINFPNIGANPHYITALNIVAFFNEQHDDIDLSVYKREVFKAINEINKIARTSQ